MKVLVADDDPALRGLVREVLESSLQNCELFEAANGDEAWQLLDSGTAVDVCIFDLKMPGMGGMELVAKLRQDDRFKQQKIMVCSGVNERDPILEAVSLGVDGYLLKPFERGSLPDRVRKLSEKPGHPPVVEALGPVNEALQRLGINREIYVSRLKNFTDEVSSVVSTLRGEWTPDIRKESAIRLGSIQGSGKNLGALPLAARAGSLEKSVVANEVAAKVPKIAALEVENKRVIAATAKIAVTAESAADASDPSGASQKSTATPEGMEATPGIIAETQN